MSGNKHQSLDFARMMALPQHAHDQDVLAEPARAHELTDEDRRGLNPLFTSNMTPYGEVKLNMTSRLDLSDPTRSQPDTDALAA